MLGKIPPPPQKKKVEIFLDPPKVNLFRERDAYNQGWGAGKFFSGSSSGSGSWFFSQVAPAPGIFFGAAPAPGGPKKSAPAPSYWSSLAKYSFPRKLVSKTAKNIKKKIIV